jgi:hypothetical protein
MGKTYFLRRLQRPSLNNSHCRHSACLCKTGKTTQKRLVVKSIVIVPATESASELGVTG